MGLMTSAFMSYVSSKDNAGAPGGFPGFPGTPA